MTTQIAPLEELEEELDEIDRESEQELEEIAGGEHGEIAIILSGHLFNYVYSKKLGRLFDGQTTFRIGGKPPTRRPNVAFVTLERMPKPIKGDIPFPPDLAVEIYSPSDPGGEVDEKIVQYQQANVRLIWLIRPVLKLVEIHHPGDRKPLLLSIDDELDGENVIPGFRLKVSALFEYEELA